MSSCPDILPKAYQAVKASDVETGSDLEQVRARRSIARVAAAGAGVAVLVAVLVCGAFYHKGTQVASSKMDGVVGFDALPCAPVAPWIKPKPSICNVGIVLDVCLRLNQKSPKYFDNIANSPKAVVTVPVLMDYFMASKGAVVNFLTKIGAPNVGSGKVRCQDLCDKTMASFPAGLIPPMVDVGCYFKPPALAPTCSVDVGLNVLAHTELPRGSPAKLGKQFLVDRTKMADTMKDEDKIFDDLMSQGDVSKYQALVHPDVGFEQLMFEAARLFRVFPASSKVTLDIADTVTTQRRLGLYSDTCASANNNVCDVPFSCPDGTDCTDCGNCNGQLPDDTCHYSKDDECDEARYCLVGTDCTDCDTCGLGGADLAAKLKSMKPNDSCPGKSRDGTCDPECEEGTDCTDCGTCPHGASVFAPPQYPDLVLRAGTKVQALLAAALLGVVSGEAPEIMEELVGVDNTQVRDEIKRMIMGLSRMLDNVVYKYPGPLCKEDTYAYVEVAKYKVPSAKAPSQNGQYIMNLCKSYMAGNSMEQYSSIIATGIRAMPMLANDEVLDGHLVAGVDMVKKLGAKCKAEGGDVCGKSARNAHTIMHVINKFIKQAM